MPPSAINGILDSFNPFEHSIIADNCGTPTPAIILVVQILPGPIPTFIASAPAAVSYTHLTLPTKRIV